MLRHTENKRKGDHSYNTMLCLLHLIDVYSAQQHIYDKKLQYSVMKKIKQQQ